MVVQKESGIFFGHPVLCFAIIFWQVSEDAAAISSSEPVGFLRQHSPFCVGEFT
jgi:hypothetical protein